MTNTASAAKSAGGLLGAPEVLDRYFLELRAKLLEIAATLDRFDRAADAQSARGDARLAFMQQAIKILQQSATADRAEQIQRLYSLP